MDARTSDEQLWCLVDGDGAPLEEHLALHPEDRARADELRRTIGAVSIAVAAASMPTPDRIGTYRIEREIGRGGGGIVYEAWQEDPPRRVALKVLRDGDHTDRHALARLRREAEALGRLSHPHVATIFEAGCTKEGHPFLAMELVHGSTLAAHAQRQSLSLRARVRLFRDVCEAVHHAHRQGVIHRDLKASNVLVDGELGIKVVDFGLARLRDAVGANVTQNGGVLGTFGYMSPEQAAGADVDERTDVYSLGVVLYELATGALPFDVRGKNSLDAARAIAEKDPPAPRKLVPDLDRDLETIVLKAMEKEPEQRYGSAAAIAEDVACWLASRPILARRTSTGYRLRKLVARNRVVSALIAGLIGLALATGYVWTFRPHVHLGSDWYATASPFEGLKWIGDEPQVQLGSDWYDLVSIDGLDADYIIGFCKQENRPLWRKRFSEDLLQVLNLMGDWPVHDVDLVLRDRETSTLVERSHVALGHLKRQAIVRDRNLKPFDRVPIAPAQMRAALEAQDWTPGVTPNFGLPRVRFREREFEVVALDGVLVSSLPLGERRPFVFSYDGYCTRVGRSPSSTMRLQLRDVATGKVDVFEDVPRDGSSAPAVASR